MKCQMYHSDTGKQCRAEATTHVYQEYTGDFRLTLPRISWEVYTCSNHAEHYIHSQAYKIKQLERNLQHG